MLLQRPVTRIESAVIDLPYYCKENRPIPSYYRVGEDGSVLMITIIGEELASISVNARMIDSLEKSISNSIECSPKEVEDAKNRALKIMEETLSKSML